MKSTIIPLLIIYGCFTGIFSLRTFWLEDYCKEDGIYSLSMISEDIHVGELNFTFRAGMEEDFTCTVIVGSKGFEEDRLAFHITSFDMGDNCGPGETWLSVMEGDLTIDPKPINGLSDRLCGRTFPGSFSTEYTTEWRHLLVRYHANEPSVGSGFSIVFKHFSNPPCASYEYKCENDRCIHNSQKCKNYNPCGDNSDCKTGITAGTITGIIIGGSAGVGILVFLWKYLPTCFKSDSPSPSRANSHPQIERPETTQVTPGAPYPVRQTERQESDFHDPEEPPSYASLEDISAKVPKSSPNRNGVTSYISGASDRVAVERGTSEESDDYRPPPPSYEMAVNFRDEYSVTDSQPTSV